MKHVKLPSIAQLLLFLGIAIGYAPTFLKAQGEEEVTIEERIQDLRRRQVPSENVAKELTENLQKLGETIGLEAKEQKDIQDLTAKLKNLATQTTDTYTQSEAHLSLPYIRKLIAENFPDTEKYLNIISSALAKEAKFKKTHDVFYHAQDNIWRIPRDLYRKLYERLHPLTQKVKDFEFMRWERPQDEKSSKEFILDELRHYGFIDDDLPAVKSVLLSVNLALFGNVGNTKKCTWEYFMSPTSVQKPSPGSFESVLNMFGASYKYVDQLINLSSLLRTKEQTLLQIFIPKTLTDDVSYIAFGRGMPADQQTIDWIADNLARRRKHQKSYPYMKSLEALHNKFREEKEKNPIYKELLERAEEGDFSVSELLEIYRNNPHRIDNINALQARLTFTNSILTDPSLPIKFFHYDTLSQNAENQYNKRLDEIVDLITQELLRKAKAETEK